MQAPSTDTRLSATHADMLRRAVDCVGRCMRRPTRPSVKGTVACEALNDLRRACRRRGSAGDSIGERGRDRGQGRGRGEIRRGAVRLALSAPSPMSRRRPCRRNRRQRGSTCGAQTARVRHRKCDVSSLRGILSMGVEAGALMMSDAMYVHHFDLCDERTGYVSMLVAKGVAPAGGRRRRRRMLLDGRRGAAMFCRRARESALHGGVLG